MKKILITDKVHPLLNEALTSCGWEVDYHTEISLDEVHSVIHKYDGIVINSKINMDKELIDKGERLTFVARLGSGMEIIDIPYARSRGIRVINSPEGNCNAVGEQAMGMLVMLATNLHKGHHEVSNFIWNREGNRGFEIKGKTVGVIGVGNTGMAFASKLQCWDVAILGYDKFKSGYGTIAGVVETDLGTLLKESDIISFHVPLTEVTIGMCDGSFLDQCKEGVVIINTSRGQVIKTKDLIARLETGQVGGVCLDVFENEKVDTYTPQEKEMYARLFSFPNVVVSPHVAGWTQESLQRIAELVLERINSDYTMEG
jgi:D-3-phosphoglycerate dehydrogenase